MRWGFSKWALGFILLYCGFNINLQRRMWKEAHATDWDVQEYYMLVPAAFIYHDLTFSYQPKLPPNIGNRYSIYPTPIGKGITRRSIGMPIMYTPFFLVADLVAGIAGVERNGYTQPYQFFVFISGFVYAFIGLLYLRKILLRYFSEMAAGLTLLCITLCTNLYHYSVMEGAMSHAPLFGLFAAFLYYTIRWHESPKRKFILAIAIIGAISILIRPTAIVIFLLFFLYGIYNKETFTAAMQKYRRHFGQLILMAITVILIGLPQLIYWKVQAGEWFYYTYGKERFYFADPRILQVLFSYRKGWLVYSPIMALSVIGFFWLKRYAKELLPAIGIFVLVHIYIISCWWCWWYGGSFGMRAMVEVYALLALPMAAFWQTVLTRSLLYYLSLFIAVQGICFNLYLNKMYAMGILHWDSTTKAFFWAMLREDTFPKNGEKLLDPPNYDAALAGERSR